MRRPIAAIGHDGGMTTPSEPRSVKISDDERGAWTSDRTGRGGRPPRPPDISVRSRVLRPADRLRYSPGSLLVIVSASPAQRDRFAQRVLEDRSALFSLDKVRALLAGRVPADDLEERATHVLDAAVAKRLQANETVVIAADGVGREAREGFVRMAAAAERPRHLILLEVAREHVPEEDRATLNELRRALDAGELGAEGFQTVLRLGGAAISEVKRILFRPPPRDD
jgi:predicted kinase